MHAIGSALGVVFWTAVLGALGTVLGLVCLGIDRVLVARMQARIGPPLSQPFRDLAKLLLKQNIVPDNAIPWLFNAAPVAALAASVSLLLYIPLGPLAPALGGYGDLVLVMYLLAVPALAMVAGGFAAGSPYATLGAQREMVTMISYELPLAAVVIAIGWKLGQAGVADPFALAAIAAHPVWALSGPCGVLGFAILFIALLLVAPGELGRIPFDTPEAETELAGGLLVEYSGRNLALFQLALAVKTVVMSALLVALFIPYGISDMLPLWVVPAVVLDAAFFLVKLLVVMFLSVSLIRAAVGRFRITQVVDVYWKYLGGLALVGLGLVMLDSLIGGR
jgi:formate hydrogenlyase subunit 4